MAQNPTHISYEGTREQTQQTTKEPTDEPANRRRNPRTNPGLTNNPEVRLVASNATNMMFFQQVMPASINPASGCGEKSPNQTTDRLKEPDGT
jgi:hypothetical protein